jgi:tryptophan halogenase
MLGQGLVPTSHHPVADLMDDAELSRLLDEIRSSVTRTVAQLPPHQDCLHQCCDRPGLPAHR